MSWVNMFAIYFVMKNHNLNSANEHREPRLATELNLLSIDFSLVKKQSEIKFK